MAANTSATDPAVPARPPRLSRATLARVPAHAHPRVPLDERRTGIVHLGPGAFHRAHQAVHTEDAMAAAGDPSWGICAVTQRSRAVVDQLVPQDGLFSVLLLGDAPPGHPRARVVGALTEVLSAPGEPAAVAARLADPDVRVVTLTVTEKGYRRDPATGGLARHDPLVAHDLAGAGAPRTTIGRLVAGLRLRHERGGPPLAVLPCDNLPANGPLVRRLVQDFLAALPGGDALAQWVDARVAFPATAVDRIVPAPRPRDLERVTGLLGVRDAAAVAAEPYSQWVIEDRFPAGRPAWDAAGADLVADVTPFETAKLRLLNATHSALAYLGSLAGAPTVDRALALPGMETFAEELTSHELLPTLRPCPGLDLEHYRARVLDRLANPALGHTTRQVAADGTEKLPVRVVAPLREHLAAGRVPQRLLLVLAAWMRHVTTAADLDDPRAAALRRARAHAGAPARAVESLLALRAVFDQETAASPEIRTALTAHLTTLTRHGVTAALRQAAG
ncbi:mannitol dehydrogenase family protein [Streptomyces sp. MP131-18]|uniref:mannitol dehydrogenase family protein n=1 Tax=Streptomyces sp. MP131-18 TaxID=1857892 RepID=UPI00097C3988|nr:mannitol dehydrogenase family protein [Streptomyces sp. MP131-18]ONK11680.1 Polyol:NADP oxidoreductase [Streptomyces sp. MP131-18]